MVIEKFVKVFQRGSHDLAAHEAAAHAGDVIAAMANGAFHRGALGRGRDNTSDTSAIAPCIECLCEALTKGDQQQCFNALASVPTVLTVNWLRHSISTLVDRWIERKDDRSAKVLAWW